MIKEIISGIVGAEGFVGLSVHLFYAMIGVAITLLYHGAQRDVDNPQTPKDFKLSFLLRDNWKRIAGNILLIFVTVRFYQDFFGKEINDALCVLIGLGYDRILQFLQSKTSFLSVR